MTVSRFVAAVGVVALAAWATPSVADHESKPGQPSSGQGQHGAPAPSTDQANPSAAGSTGMQNPSAQGSDTSSPPAGSHKQAGAQTTTLDANALIGSKVRSSQGKDIGKVDRVMIDPKEGKIESIMISAGGGMLGGGKTVSVPWDQVKIAQEGDRADRIVLIVDQQVLDQAPAASPRAR